MKSICIFPDCATTYPLILQTVASMATNISEFDTFATCGTCWAQYTVEDIATYYAAAFGPVVSLDDVSVCEFRQHRSGPDFAERQELIRDYIHAIVERAMLAKHYEEHPRQTAAALSVLTDRLAQLREDAERIERVFLKMGHDANRAHVATCADHAAIQHGGNVAYPIAALDLSNPHGEWNPVEMTPEGPAS